jgi:hypothetical protein
MIAIPPFDLTAGGVLISTNAVDAAAYNAGTTYALNAVVSYASRNWLSLQAGNTGNTPDASPLWWLDDGPINSLAMFDSSVQTATTRTGGLTWTLEPGRFTSVGLLGLLGQSVNLTIMDGLTEIHNETRTLASSDGTYYSFCLEDFFQTRETTFYGLPSTPTAQATITISGAGTTACGLCVVGKQFYAGEAQYGFSTPIEDRGRHYLDTLGNPVNLERGYSKGMSGALVNDRVNYNRLNAFLADHVGVEMLWVAAPGMNDLVAATAYGRYTRAVPVIESYNQITTALEIAGNQ